MMSEDTGTAGEPAVDDGAKPPAKKTPTRKRTSTTKTAAKSPTAKKTTAAKKTGSRTAAATVATKSTTKTSSPKPAATSSKRPKPSDSASKTAPEPTPTKPVAEELNSEEEAGQGTNTSAQDSTEDQAFAAIQERDWGAHLKRGAFMLFFGFLGWLAVSTGFALAALQFVVLLITGKHNDTIQSIIVLLGRYVSEVMDYLSFKTDTKPFPLESDLPAGDN